MAVNFKQSEALSGVNLTPMIDCIFQLLLFFMLASQFKDVEDVAFQGKLASANAAQPLIATSLDVFVDVGRSGEFVVKGRQIEPAELRDYLLQNAADNRLTSKVLIRADEAVPFGSVVEVTNYAREAGLEYQFVAPPAPE